MREAFDVVVVGFGLAGAIAAIEAHDAGAKVLIVEKQSGPGGISICAGGGIRTVDSADKAFAYLKASNASTTPEPVLMVLARGMVELANYVRTLAEPLGATTNIVPTNANYALPGYETWGYVEVDHVPGFDAAAEYPHMRTEGDVNGKYMFRIAHEHVVRRGIAVRLGSAVDRLWRQDGEISGVICGDAVIPARRAVVLACGGFEASEELQRQFWPTPPMRSVATLGNTGDGIRMAQEAGAGLWHMWHLHGVYGFHHPDSEFKLGIRIRRLRNWTPGIPSSRVSLMSWIVVDRRGKRFMNEYDPYMQDTNHRPMALYDQVTQSYPRIPSVLVVDAKGRELYPLCQPIYNDADIAARFNKQNAQELDEQVLVTRSSLNEIASEFDLDMDGFAATIAEWNAACAAGIDRAFGRPSGSMMPIAQPPFSAAKVWPIVSNTQGGLPHDEDQRVLNSFGEPIRHLYVAGELGSVFGHLYIAGGNFSECLISGRISGVNAARHESWSSIASA
jgi:succinate dehydrogenase/fumarate reductase flavoprotein subunit